MSWINASTVITIMAVVSMCLILKKLISLLYVHYIGYYIGHTVDVSTLGKWCVITGCTSGIGKSYAYAFAKKGLNIVLVSRNIEKLNDVSKDLVEKFAIKTKIIVADFSKFDLDMYATVRKELDSENLDIGVLVNNAGVLQKVDRFCEIPNVEKEIINSINTNATGHLMMTSMVLPQLVAKNRGLVIFVSSIAALTPSSQMSIYGSTKAFIDYFAKTLQFEYYKSDVIIQSVLPGPVISNMIRLKEKTMVPTADTYVEHQMRTIGLTDRTVGYFWHNYFPLLFSIFGFLPKKVSASLQNKNMSNTKDDVFGYQNDIKSK